MRGLKNICPFKNAQILVKSAQCMIDNGCIVAHSLFTSMSDYGSYKTCHEKVLAVCCSWLAWIIMSEWKHATVASTGKCIANITTCVDRFVRNFPIQSYSNIAYIYYKKIFKQRMRDIYLQDWNSEIENSSRARTYTCRLCCSFGLDGHVVTKSDRWVFSGYSAFLPHRD